MRKFKTPACRFSLILFLICLSAHFSCRKPDHQQPKTEIITKKENLFTVPINTDPAIAGIADALNRENAKTPFAGILETNAGYPQWAHAAKNSTASSRNGNPDQLMNIPFIKKGTKSTSAILAVKISSGDTTYQLIYPQYYILYGMDDENNRGQKKQARDFFNVFANFDYQLFGTIQYFFNDGRIFGKNKKDSLLVTVRHENIQNGRQQHTGGISQNAAYLTQCNTTTACVYAGNSSSMRSNESLMGGSCVTTTSCSTIWWDENAGGGNSTGVSGGGVPGVTGGGSSTGTTSTGTSPTIPVLTSTPCARLAATDLKVATGSDPCGGTQPWTPTGTGYVLNADEIKVWNQIKEEDRIADAGPSDCKGTGRTGNMNWKGTLEHMQIQMDYIVSNPLTGQREYQIPTAGAGGGYGYADLVNILTSAMFEIKPAGSEKAGQDEVEHYIDKAKEKCTPTFNGLPMPPWSKGKSFSTRYLPSRYPDKYLKVWLSRDGVISYDYVPKSGITVPLPVVIPKNILDQLKELIEKLKKSVASMEVTVSEYLSKHPELKTYIKTAAVGAAVAIVVGTIIEDIFTGGAGIWDDIASFKMAFGIVRYAWAIP